MPAVLDPTALGSESAPFCMQAGVDCFMTMASDKVGREAECSVALSILSGGGILCNAKLKCSSYLLLSGLYHKQAFMSRCNFMRT